TKPRRKNERKMSDYHTNPRCGWNTTSLEYVEHVTGMQRMPSVTTDVPDFPNVHSALQNNVIYEEECDDPHQQVNHHNLMHQAPVPQKKVQFTEHEKSTEVVKDGKTDQVHVEKDINMEADGFIQQKHRKFELYKWATFKGR
ncbi:hypothetical protein ACH5RR_025453, partial [Cinchona calisaya]